MATLAATPRFTEITLASTTAGPFSVGFRIFSTDLRVYVDGVLVTGWTITAAFADGFSDTATITLPTAATSGAVIRIESVLPPARLEDYIPSEPGLAQRLNIELARLWSVTGDLYRDFDRQLEAPEQITGPLRTLAQFGAVGDGVTDDGPAIQAALEASAGRLVMGTAGAVYRVATQALYDGNVNLDWNGARWVCDADINPFQFRARFSDPILLTADYVIGSTNLAVTGLPRIPQAGDRIHIVSDARDPSDRDLGSLPGQYRVGEDAWVGVGSTSTNIVLTRPLRFTRGIASLSASGDEASVDSYTTANTARIVLMDPGSFCFIRNDRGAVIDGQDANGWNNRVYDIRGYDRGHYRDGVIDRAYGPAVNLGGTYGFLVDGLVVGHLTNNPSLGQLGYGVADHGTATRVRRLHVARCRHAYTTTSPTALAAAGTSQLLISVGRTVGAVISEVFTSGPAASGIDTHHDGTNIRFSDCFVSGADFAYTARGRALICSNLTGRQCAAGVRVFTEFQSGDPDDDLFTNGKLLGDITSATVISPDLETSGPLLTANAAVMRVEGQGLYFAPDHRAILCEGGLLTVSGRHDFLLTATSTANIAVGVIDCSATSAFLAAAIPTATLEISGVVEIDGRTLTGAVIGLRAAASTQIIVTGRVRIRLPAGATASSGTVIVSNGGRIDYEIGGVLTSVTSDGAAPAGTGTFVYNAPNLATLTGDTFTITVNGAQVGDRVAVSCNVALQEVIPFGHVSAANTVTVRLFNSGTVARDLASATFTATVWRP